MTRTPMKEVYFSASHNIPTEYLHVQGSTCETQIQVFIAFEIKVVLSQQYHIAN